MATDQDKELTVPEVAVRLGIGSERVRARIIAGKLKARKEGRKYLIKEKSLREYLEGTEKT
jgi:excisionase family DNA binding protein